jgi:glutaredoxin
MPYVFPSASRSIDDARDTFANRRRRIRTLANNEECTEMADTNSSIVMYGADWCPDCVRSKAYLDGRGVAYTYVDLEAFPEHDETVKSYNGGNRPIPTIVFADGSHLAEPTDAELGAKLDAV